MRCSGNPSQVMQQLKIACLSYTQAPISYANKDYLVSELLKVKARVISQTQSILREKIYATAKHSGINIRECPDERSFVISPLLEANPYEKMPSADL